MRISTSTIMRNYNTRLNSVLNKLNQASDRVTTGRKFAKASEDPASATRAFQLRREYLKNEDYITNLRDVTATYDSVESSMMNVSKIVDDAVIDVKTAMGIVSPEQRKILAEKLREMQKSVVMEMNGVAAGQYLFGGSSTKAIPFELSADGKTLTYRGLDVDDPANQTALKNLADEKIFVDLGFGLTITNGTVNESSAYNMAMPGINVIGYGKDSDGNSKNIVIMLGKLADELEKPTLDTATIDKLSKNLSTGKDNLTIGITKLGTNSTFLEYTQKRLEDAQYNYNVKIVDTELIKPEEAITDFKMQDYVYRATLQMGMNILTPSFIDFMR